MRRPTVSIILWEAPENIQKARADFITDTRQDVKLLGVAVKSKADTVDLHGCYCINGTHLPCKRMTDQVNNTGASAGR